VFCNEGEEESRQKAMIKRDITLKNTEKIYSEGSISSDADLEFDYS
jgi:hypothetical protein